MKPSPHLNLYEAIAQGVIEAPAGDDHPAADRWRWFADLYAHRTWGLVAVIDGFPRLAAEQIAAACRDTATDNATLEQWHAIADIARTARTAAHSPGLDLAWSAVADTCTDALDHLAGHTVGGLEAILGALDAIGHEHETPVAMSFCPRGVYRLGPPHGPARHERSDGRVNHQVAVDRDGREWALVALDSVLKARLVCGTATPAVLDLEELVETYGPVILSPTPCSTAGGFVAFADTVGLVASDPETASVEQVRQVAAFAQSIILPHGS